MTVDKLSVPPFGGHVIPRYSVGIYMHVGVHMYRYVYVYMWGVYKWGACMCVCTCEDTCIHVWVHGHVCE